jgi:hypothetical protein
LAADERTPHSAAVRARVSGRSALALSAMSFLAVAGLVVLVVVGVVVAITLIRHGLQDRQHRKRRERAHRDWEADCPVPREAFAQGGYHDWLKTEQADGWLRKKPLPWDEEYRP